MKKHAILVVDDEIDNVDALERLFRKTYKVFKALSGSEGLEILAKNNVALIISDQRMPQMTGVEFLKKSIKTHPEAIRILLTGYTDLDSVIEAINSGQVYRYITKPWDPVDLSNTVNKAIEKYELRFELKEKNEQLKDALDELKTLDQAKTQFMMLVNHELKTPLTVILSFLELLKESSLDNEQKKYVERLGGSAQRLQKLIDDVLLLLSAETGQMKVVKKKVDLRDLFSKAEMSVANLAQANEQQLDLSVPDESFKADPQILEQVLVRLAENAVKFGEKKSTIKWGAAYEDSTFEFYVTNKGKALSKKVIQKILKPFALDENLMNHAEGTGLGLSLCQSLLKVHDSQLEFSSGRGEVTVTFRISDK